MNHFTIFLSVAALVGSAAASLAQTTSPYAGQEQRAIKALSDREISDLTEGRGLGLAKAASSTDIPGQCMYWNWPILWDCRTNSVRRFRNFLPP
jgi:hypothetical protein